jgi:hypothetical protein
MHQAGQIVEGLQVPVAEWSAQYEQHTTAVVCQPDFRISSAPFLSVSLPLDILLHLQVPDHENPEFFKILDRMVQWNTKIIELGQSGLPAPIVTLLRLPYIERMVAETAQLFFMTPLRTGSVDMEPELQTSVVY